MSEVQKVLYEMESVETQQIYALHWANKLRTAIQADATEFDPGKEFMEETIMMLDKLKHAKEKAECKLALAEAVCEATLRYTDNPNKGSHDRLTNELVKWQQEKGGGG